MAALAGVTLEPVMTLRAQLVNVKPIAAGDSVSYGCTWTATEPTVVGLVPLGYADGVPRHAGSRTRLGWRGGQVPMRGRVCMDQIVVDLGPGSDAAVGDEVVVFGPGRAGRADRGGLGRAGATRSATRS